MLQWHASTHALRAASHTCTSSSRTPTFDAHVGRSILLAQGCFFALTSAERPTTMARSANGY